MIYVHYDGRARRFGVGLDWIGWTGWIRVSILFFCSFLPCPSYYSYYTFFLGLRLTLYLYHFTYIDACQHSGYLKLLNSIIILE